MTYLDIVNNILVRLRERTVSTVSETAYSSLIGVLINDAKVQIESAWNWSALRETKTATTADGSFSYELNGLKNKFTLIDVVNDTDDFFLSYRSSHYFNQLFLNAEPQRGSPVYYSFNGVSSDGDTQVDLYPIPDGVYTIRFNVVTRTDDLVNDADVLSIPDFPVRLLAYAMAVEERGEDGATSSVSAFQSANNAIQDFISLDADKHPEELIWIVE